MNVCVSVCVRARACMCVHAYACMCRHEHVEVRSVPSPSILVLGLYCILHAGWASGPRQSSASASHFAVGVLGVQLCPSAPVGSGLAQLLLTESSLWPLILTWLLEHFTLHLWLTPCLLNSVALESDDKLMSFRVR